MEEKQLIKWIRDLELSPKEDYMGETGFMFHAIIHALAEFQALKKVLDEEGIKISPKQIAKYKWK